MDIALGFVFSVAASILGTYLYMKNRELRKNRHLRALLDFGSDELLFVFAHREHQDESILPRIATEDFIAMNNVIGALVQTGWDGQIRVRDTTHLTDADKQKNLVTLGGGKVNDFTEELLELLATREIDGFQFRETPESPGRWQLIHGDFGRYVSRSYEAKEIIEEINRGTTEAELKDVAIVAKVTNPLHSPNKIIIIAGIRGIGTWGAAEFLRKKANEIYQKKRSTHGFKKTGDFAAIFTIRYKNFDILGMELHEFIDIS